MWQMAVWQAMAASKVQALQRSSCFILPLPHLSTFVFQILCLETATASCLTLTLFGSSPSDQVCSCLSSFFIFPTDLPNLLLAHRLRRHGIGTVWKTLWYYHHKWFHLSSLCKPLTSRVQSKLSITFSIVAQVSNWPHIPLLPPPFWLLLLLLSYLGPSTIYTYQLVGKYSEKWGLHQSDTPKKIVETLKLLANSKPSAFARKKSSTNSAGASEEDHFIMEDGRSYESYLFKNWEWNRGKYNRVENRKLEDLVDVLVKEVTLIDNSHKLKLASYNQAKVQASASLRKRT